MAKTETPGRLHAATLDLLSTRPYNQSLRDIAEATELPEAWLKTLTAGVKDPSVNRIEKLYTYLSGKTLDV